MTEVYGTTIGSRIQEQEEGDECAHEHGDMKNPRQQLTLDLCFDAAIVR